MSVLDADSAALYMTKNDVLTTGEDRRLTVASLIESSNSVQMDVAPPPIRPQ